jgi:hypothetical protein
MIDFEQVLMKAPVETVRLAVEDLRRKSIYQRNVQRAASSTHPSLGATDRDRSPIYSTSFARAYAPTTSTDASVADLVNYAEAATTWETGYGMRHAHNDPLSCLFEERWTPAEKGTSKRDKGKGRTVNVPDARGKSPFVSLRYRAFISPIQQIGIIRNPHPLLVPPSRANNV